MKEENNGTVEEQPADKAQLIRGYFRGDYDIIKRIKADGETAYEGIRCEELDVAEEPLDARIIDMIRNLKFSVKQIVKEDSNYMPKNRETEDMAIAVLSQIENMERKLEEWFFVIGKAIGEINVIRMWGDDAAYREDRAIDAKIKYPPSRNESNEIFYDHDPKLIDLIKSIPPDRTTPLKSILIDLKNGEKLQWFPTKGQPA